MRSLIALLAGAALLLGGCPSNSAAPSGNTFAPGTGDTFGTATADDGDTFEIRNTSQNRIRVVSDGPAGNVVFDIDQDGRLVFIEGPTGTTIDLIYNADGSIEVAGNVVRNGTSEPFRGTIPAEDVPAAISTGKGLRAMGDPFTVCVAINAFCSAFDSLLDEIIGVIAHELIGVDVFPTGIGLIDDGIRAQAFERVPILIQIQGFCSLWPLLDIEACR